MNGGKNEHTQALPLFNNSDCCLEGKDMQVKASKGYGTGLGQGGKRDLSKACQAERNSRSGNVMVDSPISLCSSISFVSCSLSVLFFSCVLHVLLVACLSIFIRPALKIYEKILVKMEA